jgi:predicted O-methyltransferase YrrM
MVHLAQNPWEFAQLQRILRSLGATRLLEIGSRHGESLKGLASCLPKGSRLVSVDLGFDVDHRSENTLTPLQEALGELRSDFDAHLLVGNSHDPDMKRAVTALGPFDFAFIDGDHSEEGVRQDWQDYSPLCKVVALHDIRLRSIALFWEELRLKGTHLEIVHQQSTSGGSMGIGVVFNGSGSHPHLKLA